jgi:hypothetical protein
MYRRVAIGLIGLAVGLPAVAGEMKPEEARRFVVGKMFAFNCFEGTRGAGRIHADGSVSGSVQFRGSGPVRYVALPAGTLRVKTEAVCASVRGVPFEPCFNLDQRDNASFRGSISGLGFAYCDFNRGSARANLARAGRSARGQPRSIQPPQSAVATASERD